MNKEDIKTSFKLPIEYRATTNINDNISNDLELLNTIDSSNIPIYKYLFSPTTEIGEVMLESWNKSFTNDIQFLEDSQKLYSTLDISQNTDIINKMVQDWKDIKNIQYIEEKYQYIEWDYFKWLNYNPVALHILSVLNITSPILQLVTTIMMLLLPFLLIKFMGNPITIGNYIDVLKQVIAKNQIGQLIMNFNSVPIKTKLYSLLMIGFYIYSIYQNMISCYHFYCNSFYIIDKLNSLKKYLKYTSNNIDIFSNQIKSYDSYYDFNNTILDYNDKIQDFVKQLDELPEKTKCFKTIRIFGLIMKYFYLIHYDDIIDDMVSFTFGFNGYIDTLKGLQNNIHNKNINIVKFSQKKKCSFKNIYHPSLINNDPVKNNINLNKSIIITGPNAAGKTTILKSTIINLIFSQQVGYGFYDKGVLNPYKFIHCYINIPDSCSRDSLFQSEARRCKKILDIIDKNKNDRHFCVFDELYSGTNPYEAVSNAYGYLEYIIKNRNVNVILTTHYLKLCKLFRKNKKIKNCSMKTIETEMLIPTYTYKLIKGYSKTKGGIAVLKQLNYPVSIIKKAEEIIKNI